MKTTSSRVVFRDFWVSAQKPPGGEDSAARRSTGFNPVSAFCHEVPRGGLKSVRRCMRYDAILLDFVNFLMCWYSS